MGPGRIFRTIAAVAMTAMSMGLTNSAAPVALAAPAAPAASSDNYLSDLTFDQGTLVPAFISTTQEYELTGVPYASSVTISYTPNSAVFWNDFVEGCYGNRTWCDLAASNLTTVTIKIWAEDKSTRVYTVTVTRPDSVLAVPLVAPVTKLSHGAAAEHTCAVLRTGKVLCWGANQYGQLGLGTTSKEEFVPLTVTGVTDAVDVAVGLDHTCILRTGGAVQCMGRNDHGQLGDGTAIDRTTPVDVLNSAGTGPLTGVTRISLNKKFTCATVNENALCWGGDVGLSGWNGSENVIVTHTLPLTVAGVSGAVDVAAGEAFACVLTNAGKVQCWGTNRNGEMGIGSESGSPISVPVTMKDPTGAADLTGVTAMRTSTIYTCVILTSGQQLCVGDNEDRQLGDGTDDDRVLPVTTTVTGTAEALANVAQSAPGQYHGCTLTAGGTVHCSGSGYQGVLGIGLGTAGRTSRVVTVTTSLGGPPLSGVVEVASGYDRTCARTATAVYCWGEGATGRLGSGVFDDMYSPHLSIVIPPVSSDASLAALTLDAPAVLQGTWVSSTMRYTVNVPAGETDMMFALTPSVTSTLNINGDSSAGGCDISYSQGEEAGNGGCTIDPSGTTFVTVTVTAEDGTTTLDYVIVVNPPVVSSDATLSALAIAPGTLAPAFVSGTTSYTAQAPAGTTSVAVTATVNQVNATVAYASSAGACTAGTCIVAAPKTWITATVTAADGTTTQEYFIEITVADANASNDAMLSDLTINPGTLTPAFVSTTTSYTAEVPNGTTSVDVIATTSDANATVSYASSAGACASLGMRPGVGARNAATFPTTCDVTAPKTWVTVTVTAEDGTTTEEYVIEITVAASLTTIDRVWPGTGLPEGGMPVRIFGSGFSAAQTVLVGPYDGVMASVLFTIENDVRIRFVMPEGVAGQSVSVTVQTASDSQTVADAFTYVAPTVITFSGLAGGVFTTTDGVVVEIPSQGVDGNFVITMTPLPPEPGVPGSVLMYSFRLDALLNWLPLASLTNPVTIKLPIDENIFAIADGERPWLYQWVGGSDSYSVSGRLPTKTMTIHSVAAGTWSLVRGQEYDPGTQLMTVALRPMGVYALSSAYLRAYWFPVVPTLR